MTGRVPVTFASSGVTAWVAPGETVLSAAKTAGVQISASCAGRGTCGECGVRVLEGALARADAIEERCLGRSSGAVRLACQARVVSPVTVKPLISIGVHALRYAVPDDARLVAGVDLGTTTVNAVVVDASTGREVGRANAPNQQGSWGADVLSRLSAALAGDAEDLRSAAERSIETALEAAAPGMLGRVDRLVVAGNTAMSSLLSGADVTSLATHPFSIPERATDPLAANSLLRARLKVGARIDSVPALASFVGGDVLAGLVACGVEPGRHPVMLVDIGTNAEVVLAAPHGLIVASAAAGPAFEGGGISCGGAAVPGAVSHVEILPTGQTRIETIGGEAPVWFSGAGLVSALARLRSAGHLDAEGLLHEEGPLRSRFWRDERGVLGVGMGEDKSLLWISQLDVRAVQIAKAAVRAAITIVLHRAGIKSRKLDALYIAGAFGGALDTADLVNLGIVPKRAADVVRSVGNTALAGAAILALDDQRWSGASSLASGTVSHVDLASDPEFNRILIEGVAFERY